MRVLLTNSRLVSRAGSELYVRDVARWLRDHGHAPLAYSASLGPFADELRREGVPVVDDLRKITDRPDVIHAQHHLATVTAIAAFPGVPVVALCHGWLPWEELPVRHPQIRRYIAVSTFTRELLVTEAGVPPSRVRVLPNFVDLSRFRQRKALPIRPKRALIYSNAARTDSDWVHEIRAACVARRIELDVVGLAADNATSTPERLLGKYDLVFGRGRSALEAMASGVAVIVCDVEGLAGFVAPDAIDDLRDGNFGAQVLRRRIERQAIGAEIDLYEPRLARETSLRVRATLSADVIIPELFDEYRNALADTAVRPIDAADAERALVDYLRELDRTNPVPYSQVSKQVEPELADLRSALARAQHELTRRPHLPDHLAELEQARSDADASHAELLEIRAELATRRSGLIGRVVVPRLRRFREPMAPIGSWRYRMYRRARSVVAATPPLTTSSPPSPAEFAVGYPPNARLAVVVLAVGPQPGLVDAVRSLLQQGPQSEIVVVSCAENDAEQVVNDAGLDVLVVHASRHLLPGAARNLGVAATSAPYIAFVAADHVVQPGWVAGRLAAHAAGAQYVSSAVINDAPLNPFAVAGHTLLLSARLPGTPRDSRLHYGASYARALFREHGRFRDDLRIAEDSEFLDRVAPYVAPVFRADVRVAHRNPRSLGALLAEHYARAGRKDVINSVAQIVRPRVAGKLVARTWLACAVGPVALARRGRLLSRGSSVTSTSTRRVDQARWVAPRRAIAGQ